MCTYFFLQFALPSSAWPTGDANIANTPNGTTFGDTFAALERPPVFIPLWLLAACFFFFFCLKSALLWNCIRSCFWMPNKPEEKGTLLVRHAGTRSRLYFWPRVASKSIAACPRFCNQQTVSNRRNEIIAQGTAAVRVFMICWFISIWITHGVVALQTANVVWKLSVYLLFRWQIKYANAARGLPMHCFRVLNALHRMHWKRGCYVDSFRALW